MYLLYTILPMSVKIYGSVPTTSNMNENGDSSCREYCHLAATLSSFIMFWALSNECMSSDKPTIYLMLLHTLLSDSVGVIFFLGLPSMFWAFGSLKEKRMYVKISNYSKSGNRKVHHDFIATSLLLNLKCDNSSFYGH